MSYLVGSKGQIVISKEIRDRLGVEPGWLALQRLVDDHVEIHFLPPPHTKSLLGSLKEHITRYPDPAADWHQIKEDAWNAAAQEKESYLRERSS